MWERIMEETWYFVATTIYKLNCFTISLMFRFRLPLTFAIKIIPQQQYFNKM